MNLSCFNFHRKGSWDELEITTDFKVLPCCAYHSQARSPLYPYNKHDEIKDEYFDSLPPDWNDLSKHSLKKILSHKVFTEYLTDKNWQDEKKCPPFCKWWCSKEE